MTTFTELAIAGVMACLLASVHRATADVSPELVANPQFRAGSGRDLPDGWTLLTPVWEKSACTARVDKGLLIEAPGRPFAVGGAWQDLRGIRGGSSYAVEARCRLTRIPSPRRSVLVRLTWTAKGTPLHPAGMYVRGPLASGKEVTFQDVLTAPKEADGARLSLEVKWPQGGSVLWRNATVRPADPPPPRKVKIGTVYLRPKNSAPERNLDLFIAQVDAAGKLGLDIVCLPEAIAVVGTPRNAAQVAGTIPGPATKRLGDAALRNHIWVVAGLNEVEGDHLYNTAVLMDREGRLAGKYRKVHLPREEWVKGVEPGDEYPVFQTDFGIVAIQICYDWFFPEAAEAFALKGAEILFAPTWGTTFPDQDGRVEGETVFRVRARDNGLYLVPSVYDGSSMVIDPLGRILASNKGQEGVFWAEVDLNAREPLWWVGHWRSIGPRDRMPDTYKPLTADP